MNNSDSKIVAGILAHVDTGKTTLSEGLLYHTGAISRLGRVDTKDTFLDTDEVERERGITIYSKNARVKLPSCEMILIDTPGHVDFSTEMERTLSILDMAILLISAPEGIQSHTKTLWKLLDMYHIPTYIFVNKMDMYEGDKDILIKNLRTNLSTNVVDFSGCSSLGSAEGSEEEFFEEAATCDEGLLNEYLENGTIESKSISDAVAGRKMFPVFFGSALKDEGIEEFIEGLDKYIFVPKRRSGAFSGRVYKIAKDKDGKRLTFLKITGGELKIKDMLGEEKVNEIRIYQGEKFDKVTQAGAGDVCALVGLNDTENGQIIGEEQRCVVNPVLTPVLSYCVKYPDDVDRTKMLQMLKEMEEEDPSLCVEYREQTKEIFVSLMGDIQAEVLKRAISDRFKVGVEFTNGKVCYKETVDAAAVGVGHFEPLRHYAEAHIKIEPLERGSGIEYDTDVSEDFLAKNWQRLILTHLMEKEHAGVLLGAPVTDAKFTLVAGRAHEKHTEGGDFRQATYRAVRQGLMELLDRGKCHLLEPYYDYTLALPEEYVGRAMTDITKMNGTCEIGETDFENHITVLDGRVPVSTMNGYMREINAYTKGLGQLSLVMAGYFDCHNEEEVLASATYNPEADLRNPTGSVFCSHGAGVVIPWYEVPERKHVEYTLETGAYLLEADDGSKEANRLRREREARGHEAGLISGDEIDAILQKSTHANENGRKASYKGISAASRDRREEGRIRRTETEFVEYKGTTHKEEYLLVDGYNVIHAWEELKLIAEETIDGAAGRLNDIMCDFQGMTGQNIIVVYDAYKVKGHTTEVLDYHNIKVVYTKEAQTADMYIERYAHDNAKKYDISVVTSDGLEQIIVVGLGCHVVSSREFKEVVDRKKKEFSDLHGVQ